MSGTKKGCRNFLLASMGSNKYMLMQADFEIRDGLVTNWKFNEPMIVDSKQLCKLAVACGNNPLMTCENFGIDRNGELSGNGISLDRLADAKHTEERRIIVAEIWQGIGNEKTRLIGYKVANYSGVKNVPLKEVISYCETRTRAGKIPFQNAVYVGEGFMENSGRKAHLKAYPEHKFLQEIRVKRVQANTGTVKSEEKADERSFKENKRDLKSEMLSKFTPEQQTELSLADRSGNLCKELVNPKLSAKQMKILREAKGDGIDISLIANPAYSSASMMMLVNDVANGEDISEYANPKFDFFQLSELSLANAQGLDISDMLDENLTAEDMAEIRIRLENKIWSKGAKWKLSKDVFKN